MDITGIIYVALAVLVGVGIGKLLGKIKISKKESTLSPIQRRIRAVIISIIVVVFLVLADIFTPIWGGQVKFYAKWIECGRLPVEETGLWAHNIEFYKSAQRLNLFRSNDTKYFCTEKEAELSGLSSNPNSYDFPHLTLEERRKLLNH